MVASTASTCPACRRDVAGDGRFCRWCRQFLIESETPLKAAGVGKRLVALVADALIGPVLLLAAFSIDSSLVVLAFLAWVAATLFLWTRGQTPGKLLLGVTVLRTDGRPAGFWRMFLREVIGKFISAIPFYLGYFWAIWDKDQQAWHDKIAETIVVSSA